MNRFLAPHAHKPIHPQMYFEGNCPMCKKPIRHMGIDYGLCTTGTLDSLLKGRINFPNLHCPTCDVEFLPTYQILFDALQQAEMARQKLGVDVPVFCEDDEVLLYGMTFSRETFEDMLAAQEQLPSYFQEHQELFWLQYEDFALKNWTNIVREVTAHEWELYYSEREHLLPKDKNTIHECKEAFLRRNRTEEQRRSEWRALNEPFIDDYIAELGPQNWVPKEDIKRYGSRRISFIIMNAPVPGGLEFLRSLHLSDVVPRNKDTEFLLKRISQQGDMLQRAHKKIANIVESNLSLRADYHAQQNKLAEAYQTIRELKAMPALVQQRNEMDAIRLEGLKALIHELKADNRALRQQVALLSPAPEHPAEAAVLEDDNISQEDTNTLLSLEGKTVAIFGGQRKEQAATLQSELPCQLLLHDGQKQDPSFYRALRDADVYIVLTQHVSHESMWDVKEWGIDQGKPQFYLKGLNIPKLLTEAAGKLLSE